MEVKGFLNLGGRCVGGGGRRGGYIMLAGVDRDVGGSQEVLMVFEECWIFDVWVVGVDRIFDVWVVEKSACPRW